MLNSDLRRDVSRSLVDALDRLGGPGLLAALVVEQQRADDIVASEWPAEVPVESSWYVDLRYPGQLWSVRVVIDHDLSEESIRRDFEERYEQLYGHIQPDGALEVTNVGVVMVGRLPDVPDMVLSSDPAPVDPNPSDQRPQRRCWLGSGPAGAIWHEVPIFAGSELSAGQVIEGPYLLEATTTTVLGLPGDRLTVRNNGDLSVELL